MINFDANVMKSQKGFLQSQPEADGNNHKLTQSDSLLFLFVRTTTLLNIIYLHVLKL